MRKSLIMSLVATVMLAGCSNNEVMETLPQKAIGFENPFVDNSTRAVNDIVGAGGNTSTFTKFYVYGSHSGNTSVFTNTEVEYTTSWEYSPLQYWIDGKEYYFAAYSDGNEQLASGVTFDNAGNLSISSYTVSTKDLIYAKNTTKYTGSTSAQTVSFTFNHLLSKVKFTFVSEFANYLTLSISNLKIVGSQKTGSYANDAWTPSGNITDIVYGDNAYTGYVSEECYVLPQTLTDVTASYTVTVKNGSETVISKAFADIALNGVTDGKWTPGLTYNYKATINDGNMGAQPIKFNVETVTSWADFTDTGLTVN